MKLYEDDEKMRAWDFVENKKIDVIEEESDSDREVSYICPRCQKKYKEKEDKWIIKRCKECFANDHTLRDLSLGKLKFKFTVRSILPYFWVVLFNSFASALTFQREIFDAQFIYMTICYTVFLLGLCMLLEKYFQARLMKNPLYQRYCITAFSLLKQEDVFELKEQVNLSLAGLIKPYVSDNYTNEDIICQIKTGDKYFGKLSNNKREIKYWKKRIQDDTYYNQLVSDFETKSIINFKVESKILNTTLEFLITFIGILLAVVNYINNWERFGWKSLTFFAFFVVVFFALIAPMNKTLEENRVGEARLRLIIISSAIAKKYKRDDKGKNAVRQ